MLDRPAVYVERVLSVSVSLSLEDNGKTLVLQRDERALQDMDGKDLDISTLPEGVLEGGVSAQERLSLICNPLSTIGVLHEIAQRLVGVVPHATPFPTGNPPIPAWRKLLRKLVLRARGLTNDDLFWYRRSLRKLSSWANDMQDLGVSVCRGHTNGTVNYISASGLKASWTMSSLKDFSRILLGVLCDLPEGDERKWFKIDTDRLSPERLVELLHRISEKVDPILLLSYSDYRRSHFGSATFMHSRSVIESLETARKELPSDLKAAAARCLWNNKRSQTAGLLWTDKIPDTPWHALLSMEANKAYSTNAHGVRLVEMRDIAFSDVLPWSLVPESQSTRWITEASYVDAVEILGWHHFSPDVIGREKDILEGKVGWDHPLSGWASNPSKTLGNRRPPLPDTVDDPFNIDLGYGYRDRYHFLFNENGMFANLDGTSWVTLLDIMSESFKYLADAKLLADKYAGMSVHDSNGNVVRMQPLKGSFRRMLKDAKYNHNVERLFLAASLKVDDSTGLPVGNTPLWVPEDASLPVELEEKRVKTREELIMLGKQLNHCVGSRADCKGKLFYNEGTVVAEVDYKLGSVTECRDARNRITDSSMKFTGVLLSSFPNVSTAGHRYLRAQGRYQLEDWKDEYFRQFPSRVWAYLGKEDIGVHLKLTGLGLPVRDIFMHFQVPYNK